MGDTDYVVGANKADDAHLKHVDLMRDVKITAFATICVPSPGRRRLPALRQAGLSSPKGIEVGHIFKLGTKYSTAHALPSTLTRTARSSTMIMGCYGIGVSRALVAACIEQNHDDNGIVFPPAVAPFDCEILASIPPNAGHGGQGRRS